MTIKEAAAQYGVSTQAIYQRIAKAGKKAKELTNQPSGDLTQEGEELLSSWFTNEQSSSGDSVCNHCKQLEALQAANNALQAQVEELQRDKDRLYTLLAQAQQTTQALTMARLTAPGEKRTQPLWQRVKVFFVGDQEG